jgi:hypothetical protein
MVARDRRAGIKFARGLPKVDLKITPFRGRGAPPRSPFRRDMVSFLKFLMLVAAFAFALIIGNVFGHV